MDVLFSPCLHPLMIAFWRGLLARGKMGVAFILQKTLLMLKPMIRKSPMFRPVKGERINGYVRCRQNDQSALLSAERLAHYGQGLVYVHGLLETVHGDVDQLGT